MVRYDEDTGEFIRYSEDEAPEVVYRGDDDNFITQAQHSQILAEKAASEAARTAAEAARMVPYYDLYQSPKVSYSGQPVSNSVSVGGYNLPEGTFADDDGRVIVRDDDGGTSIFRDEEGEPVRLSSFGSEPRELTPDSYDNAKNMYSRGYVPWNIDNVYEGLSSRQPFSLNALWGGTQYAQGRVTDWSHLDPTQYEANLIAANTRNELWNEYDKLVTQGAPPAKNPDEVALDFYVKNVGPNGNTFGYGPGANTALITEAVKHQFLNSPDVIQARGTTYQTPQEKIAKIDSFGPAHQAGVPTWQVFEKQGYSSGFSIGSLIPMIIGAIALGPMATAFAGTLGAAGGAALAGALVGGVNAEIGGGDFLKGALTGGVTGGLGSAVSGGLGATASQVELANMVESGTSGLSGAVLEAASLSPGMSSTLVEFGLPKPMADAVVKAATVAVKTGIAGGDVEQAVLGSLVNSGVGAGVSEGLAGADVSKDLAKAISSIATPVISTAVQGGDVSTALTNSLIKGGFSLAGNTINEALNTANPTQTATAPVAPEVSSPLQSANAEAAPPAVDPAWGVNPPSPEALPVDQAINNIVNPPIEPPVEEQAQNVLPPQETVNNIPDQSMINDQILSLTTLQQQEISDRIAQGESLEQALANVQTGLTDQLTGVQTGLTNQFQTGLENLGSEFSDQLTGVQTGFQTQFDQLNDAQKDQALALLSQGQSLESAISSVQTGLTEQIGDVQTGLTEQFQTGINALDTKINSYIQSGIDRDTATQLAIDDLSNDVTQSNEDINRQLTELGLNTGQAISDVQTGLTDQLTGVQQGFQTQFDQLNDAQKDQALALVSQGQSLESAIDSVKTGLTDQLAEVQTGLTGQITGLESNFQAQFEQLNDAQQAQALALVGQGETLENAIDSVKTELTGQLQTGINDLQANMNSYMQSGIDRDTALQLAIDDLSNDSTQSNEDINRQLTELGLNTGTQFEDVNSQITNLSGDINALETNINAYMQSGIDRDTATQLAIDDLSTDVTQSNEDINRQLTELGLETGTQFEDVNTQINALQTNINAYMQSGLDRDTATQMAIDDLGSDVTQSNEDINRQLTELGLDTGTQFEEVNNQINNLGGTLANYGGTLSGLLGSVSGLGGSVSGLATNVATGQAQTQKQIEGINYQNTMEKLGKILAEPNQKYDSPLKSYLTPSFVNSGQAQPSQEKDYSQIIGELSSVLGKRGYRVGGEVHAEHNPVEYIPGPEDRYYARHMKRGFAVNGPGTGQSDDIPTMLADGEYVFDADTVAALGDGSSKAGADVLNKFRESIRAHKRSAPTDKIPPKAKSPLEYLKTAQKPKGRKHG